MPVTPVASIEQLSVVGSEEHLAHRNRHELEPQSSHPHCCLSREKCAASRSNVVGLLDRSNPPQRLACFWSCQISDIKEYIDCENLAVALHCNTACEVAGAAQVVEKGPARQAGSFHDCRTLIEPVDVTEETWEGWP